MGKNILYCSFCGKSSEEAETLVAGPAVLICNECIDICQMILEDVRAKKAAQAAEEKKVDP